jgi:hypothetical protein
MADYSAIITDLRPEIEALEAGFFHQAETVRDADLASKAAFVADCWHAANALEQRWLEKLTNRTYRISHPAYADMWQQFNAAAALEIV